ncbi:MAG: endonuclease III [bacterium]|nr:endonuclease III [bacterium]
MRQKDVKKVLDILKKDFYSIETELHYSTPFQLLVAVILSAQCTDKRVNKITPSLWKAFPSVEKMAQASQDQIFDYIKTCSYPNNKAKNLLAMAQMLLSEFGGEIPQDLKLLQKLPGVGLKTAKVVSHVLFGAPVVAVDTHVLRVANRLGWVHEKNADKVSMLLEKIIPLEYKSIAHHSLIYFGRYHCTARNPKCSSCPLQSYCAWYRKQSSP